MFNKIIAASLPYMPKRLVWIFSKRYIAGETINDAIKASQDLNAQGIKVTIDLLGEFIEDLNQATENRDAYLNIIEAFEKNKIDGNYSVKPTFFGLLIDPEACYENIRTVVAKAAEYNNFIRIDMEDSSCVDKEIDIFRRLKKEFPNNVGLVIQAYLRRTFSDINNMLDIKKETSLNFRLCKGIYVEPKEVAFKKYEEVNENYIKNLDFILKNGIYPGIATHDKNLIEAAYDLLEKYNVPKDKYEFQMLYGVTPELRQTILDKGHNMRVYIPFGKDWFGYSTRRLKENPKMTMLIIKALFNRG
ncbi:proline dehydrogenase family protein [Ancylomarina sp. 16SWW S1-10-2]|uniref:proline dehydrogenase family protein n=1 Tax=Ancylomarina sp. 16SWW S1-10-2 TaxID=2499681 RepID=UPI0012AE8DEC|nr:proline dehydrogenase family protein [Ancylomarina sp. 16SWW S1-10-2]MRT91395.1 proline dehydrogenase [Ancylomarina sp. 16SWW S1-10-2]